MSKVLFHMFLIMLLLALLIYSVDYLNYNTKLQRVKHHVNLATHAASLPVLEANMADGLIDVDITAGSGAATWFYRILRQNMDLDTANQPMTGSYVAAGTTVVVHELIYANNRTNTINNLRTSGGTSCTIATSRVRCSITANFGTSDATTRDIDELIVGPAIVSIVEVKHKGMGFIPDEPIVTVGIQEVLRRK